MKVAKLLGLVSHSESLPSSIEARLSQDGYARTTIRSYMRAIIGFLEWLPRQTSLANADADTAVLRFLDHHLPSCRCLPRCPRRENSRAALGHMKRAIGEDASSPSEHRAADRLEDELNRFDEYMKDVCGLSAATRLQRRRVVQRFLSCRAGDGAMVSGSDLSRELLSYISSMPQTHTIGSMASVATGLRGYVRYLQFRGDVDPRLLCAIPVPPRIALRDCPRVLSRAQSAALVNSFDRHSPSGMRDQAMALCMLEMGLRASEVAAITLDDIDWRASVIHLRRGKSRVIRDLPVMEDCGKAIAGYLKAGRPQTSSRRLFVRHVVPVGSEMSAENVRGAMRRAYARAGLPSTMTGTHILRHTAATNMLSGGSTLKDIADVLGHQSINTTMVYTKVDTEALRCVVLPWPGVSR